MHLEKEMHHDEINRFPDRSLSSFADMLSLSWRILDVMYACVGLEGRPEVKPFTRITVDPNQMGGLPCIRSLRIPVATVVGMVSEGMTEAEILSAYPDLELEDVRESLRYAAEAVRERELPVVGGS